MKIISLISIILMAGIAACQTPNQNLKKNQIIPFPDKVDYSNGIFKASSLIISEKDDNEYPFLKQVFKNSKLNLNTGKDSNLNIFKDEALKSDSYQLNIYENSISIKFSTLGALNSSISTIKQLLALHDDQLPTVNIKDSAKFNYRGMHLDVGRHMFSVEEIKKYLDYLHFYKYNVFHWHLTEDQGWRIEIKKYPKLQEIAAYRKETLVGHYNDTPQIFDGRKYGGYYTQEEIKEVVLYASVRGIEVIPEIDIPGHTTALIAAYPELSCHGKPVETATKWGVFFDVLCPTEFTFKFLEDVFSEISELFPSKYIHIGGDECPKQQWKESEFCQQLMKDNELESEEELQRYFIERVQNIIQSKGKRIIGWDEILEGGGTKEATIMSWRGMDGALEAVRTGRQAILTPTSHCYFDYYQSQNENEPLAIGGYLPYEKIYNWDIIPKELNQTEQSLILGAQGNVWTEYIPIFSKLEYMALTRMITLSENLWGKNSGNIKNFTQALNTHINYWSEKGVNISNHLLDVRLDISVDKEKGVSVSPLTNLDQVVFQVTSPGMQEPVILTDSFIILQKEGEYKFTANLNEQYGRVSSLSFNPHLGNFSEISLKNRPAEKYSGNGPQSLINGVIGSNDRYGGDEWLGFEGTDFNADIEFSEPQKLKTITLRFFNGQGQWIYLPKNVKIWGVFEKDEQKLLAQSSNLDIKDKIGDVSFKISNELLSKIKIVAENFGTIPEGKQGAGHKAWLFVDEILIR